MNNDLLYVGIIIFIFLIIIGLYLSQDTKLNISEKNKILMENFSAQVSSTNAQKKGASQLYKWGLPEDNVNNTQNNCPTPPPEPIPPFTPIPPVPEPNCPQEEQKCIPDRKEKCYNCDILTNKDINKYVLKSSIPPCPDTSRFATKNMIHTCPDMTKYILKSEIPKCEKFDKSKYILKREIPPCPKCPICPVCPVCPVCPKPQPCKTINQYKIEEHPDISKYVKKEDLPKICQKYCKNNEEENCDKDNSNNENKDKKDKDCAYPSMIDRIFQEGSNLKTNNTNGMYAGDNLYAKF